MTAIDFTAEVEKRKEALLADLFSLLEINSERDDSKVDAEHPFGPGPVKALENSLKSQTAMATQLKMLITTQDILSLVMEKKFSESLPTWTWCQLVAVGTQTLTHQLSKKVAFMRVGLRTTRVLQQLVTMV